jgi:sterol desaturase/sphingolipid hydroxylase (fatty acid hydroxylase superfamily)
MSVAEPFTMAVLAGGYALLFALERAFPLRRPKSRLLPRLEANFVVSLVAFVAVIAVVSPVSEGALAWATRSTFGLMNWLALPPTAEFAATFLLLDLSFYYWHVANHRVPLLWRFHNAHHIDPDLDVTTAFRFHFVEVGFSAGFRLVQILAIGPALATYAIYELCFQLGTLFHHSNLRSPAAIEPILTAVIVTPRVHGIHHSRIQRETNSNFGVVFSWWDRLHGTLDLDVPQDRIVIGVPGYASETDNRPWSCLAMPFRRQREYWRPQDPW